MSTAAIGIACAAVFFLAVLGVFYLRKVKGASPEDDEDEIQSQGPSMFAKFKRKQKPKQAPVHDPKQRTRNNNGTRGERGDGRRAPQQQQSSSSGGQRRRGDLSTSNYADSQSSRRNNRHFSVNPDEMEAPIPGLFDVPDYDNPNAANESSASMPRMPSAVATSDASGGGGREGGGGGLRGTQSAGDMMAINMNGNSVIDRRFPENPMPSDMTSILERMQDPRYEDSLPRPAPTTTNEADYSMYYGPYMPGGGPPPPPPPPGSTELYSMMPQNGDPRYTSARNQHHPPMPPMPAAMYYDPRYMAMADHYHRQMQPMQPMPPMQPMQPMPPMQPVPPMQPAPPVPPILGAGHQQREEVRQPQPPRPVATASSSASAEPRFGSPEEEQAWKRANRMTTSSPPAYSLL